MKTHVFSIFNHSEKPHLVAMGAIATPGEGFAYYLRAGLEKRAAREYNNGSEVSMQANLVEKGPIHLVGLLTVGTPEEIVPRMNEIWMEQFIPHAEQLRPFSVDHAFYGAWFWIDEDTTAYMAGMAVENLPALPLGLEERELPAATYAVFDCTVSTIGHAYDQAYHQWLPASIYEFDLSASDFEFYPPSRERGDKLAQVYIPVREKPAPPTVLSMN